MIKKIILLLLITGIFGIAAFAQDDAMPGQEDKRFDISGFMQFTASQYQVLNKANNKMGTLLGQDGENSYFSQSDLNLYFTFYAAKHWLAFAEVRFLYSPSGMEGDSNTFTNGAFPPRIYTQAKPYNNYTYDTQYNMYDWGSIYLERAYIEWNQLSFAKFRFGRFLTPFGIWSQDHGAPILTSIRVPQLVSTGAPNTGMPRNQTGIELLGQVNISMLGLLVDYAAYIGNGISNDDAQREKNDNNKSYGGFINFTLPPIANMVDIELGGSGYRGTRSIIYDRFYELNFITTPSSPIPVGGYPVHDPSQDRYLKRQNETAALWHYKMSVSSLPLSGVLVFQAEGMRQWIHEKSDRSLVGQDGSIRSLQPENFTLDIYYFQIEYRMFNLITPYYRYETFWNTSQNVEFKAFNKNGSVQIFGLNFRPAPKVAIKAEYGQIRMNGAEEYGGFRNYFDFYQGSVSLAF